MRPSPAAASVEVTGTLIVGLLLSGPADSVATATRWAGSGATVPSPVRQGTWPACPTSSCPSCGGERVTRSPAGSGRAE
jgi:hypothetical protein